MMMTDDDDDGDGEKEDEEDDSIDIKEDKKNDDFKYKAPVIVGDRGDIAGLKYLNLTSDESRQCRRYTGNIKVPAIPRPRSGRGFKWLVHKIDIYSSGH